MRATSKRKGAGDLLKAMIIAEKFSNESLTRKDMFIPPEFVPMETSKAPPVRTPHVSGDSSSKPPKARKTAWTSLDEACLASLVDLHGEAAWETIAANMKDRTSAQCEQHFKVMRTNKSPRKPAELTRRVVAEPDDEDDDDDDDDEDEDDDEPPAPLAASSQSSSARQARLAFLAHDAAPIPSSPARPRPDSTLMPEWLAPSCVSVSSDAAQPALVYTTAVVDPEAID